MKFKKSLRKQVFALILLVAFSLTNILPIYAKITDQILPNGGQTPIIDKFEDTSLPDNTQKNVEEPIDQKDKSIETDTSPAEEHKEKTSLDEKQNGPSENNETSFDDTTTYKGVECAAEEVLVVFSENISTNTAKKEIKSWDTTAESPVKTNGDLTEINVPANSNVEEFIEELKKEDTVEHVQPNFAYKMLRKTNDPKVSKSTAEDEWQWHLEKTNISSDSKISAWDFVQGQDITGEKIKIAILDTGANPTITEFTGNIDKPLIDVYDAAYPNQPLKDGLDPHGTHVAGIAAAVGDNEILGAGVSYKSSLMIINVFKTEEDAYTSDIIRGYKYAVDNGAKVINMSFGGYGWDTSKPKGSSKDYDTLFEEAINNAYDKGVISVAAGGNGDDNLNPITKPSYPADFDKCISVVPLNQNKERPKWADYNKYKDISAPGVGIYSNNSSNPENNLISLSGSSMASPYVAGVMALIFSANPDLTSKEATEILYNTTNDLGTPGRDDKYGHGEVNPLKAVKKALLKKTILTVNKSSAFLPDAPEDLEITLQLPIKTNATINIVNSEGKVINAIAENTLFAKDTPHKFNWNYKNTNGEYVVPDEYKIEAVLPYNDKIDREVITKSFKVQDLITIKSSETDFKIKPSTSKLSIDFSANTNLHTVSAKIVNSDNTLIKTIPISETLTKNDGTYTFIWDYKDDNGKLINHEGKKEYSIITDVTSDTYGNQTFKNLLQITVPTASAKISGTTTATIDSWNKVNIKYSISTDCYTTIKIYNSKNKLVRTLMDKKLKNGTNTLTWNFKSNSGKYIVAGKYKIEISGYNLYGHFKTASFKTKITKPAKPKITKVKLSKATIVRANLLNTKISLKINVKSQIKVIIRDTKGKVIRTIYNKVVNKGTKSYKWNLKDDNKKLVKAGTYKITIYSKNSTGTTKVSKKIKVVKQKPKITKIKTAKSFNAYLSSKSKPYTTFNLSGGSAEITAKVYTKKGKFVKTIYNKKILLAGNRKIKWNCKNYKGDFVPTGTYYIKIVAKNPNGKKTIRTNQFKMKYKLYIDKDDLDIYSYGSKVYIETYCTGLPTEATAVIKFYNPSGKHIKTLKKSAENDYDYYDDEYEDYGSSVDTYIAKSELKTKGVFTVKIYFTFKGSKSNTSTVYVNVN